MQLQFTSCPVATSIAVCTVPDALFVCVDNEREEREKRKSIYIVACKIYSKCVVIKREYEMQCIHKHTIMCTLAQINCSMLAFNLNKASRRNIMYS